MPDHITRFHVQGFRSCHNITLDGLKEITAFVGRNGVGMSNILKAIESVARNATTLNQNPMPTPRQRAEIEFTIKKKTYRYIQTLEANFVGGKKVSWVVNESVEVTTKNGWEFLITRENERLLVHGSETIQIALQAPCLHAVFSLFPETTAIAKHVRSIISFLDGIRYFPLDEISDPTEFADKFPIISETDYQTWVATLDSPTCNLDSVCLQIVHLWQTDRAKLDELLLLLGDSGLGLISQIPVQIFNFPHNADVNEKTKHYYLHFTLCKQCGADDKTSYPFSDLSVGTRRIIRLLVSALTGNTTVALIEHPEDAIHSGMVKKLMDILRVNSDRRQLFIASHSPQVFNILKPEQIRFVWMASGETAVRSLTTDELAAATMFICNEGPLSDFLESIQDC